MISLITNIFKSKKYLLFLIVFIVCFLIMLILINTKEYYQDVLENNIGSEIQNRKLIVLNNKNDTLSTIKNASNILDYYPYVYLNATYDEITLDLEYLSSYEYHILKGNSITNRNEIIVPKILSNNLGSSIKLEIDKSNYNLKVVGINNLNSIIISKELLEELTVNSNIDYYILIAQNYKYAKDNIAYFSQSDYTAFLESTDGLEEYNNLQNFISLLTKFIYFIIIMLFIFILFIIKNFFHTETKNIAILKAIGYNDLNISLLVITQILILQLAAAFISVLLFIISVYILTLFLTTDYITFSSKTKFIYDYSLLCLSSLSLVVISSIPVYFKTKRFNVVQILSEE